MRNEAAVHRHRVGLIYKAPDQSTWRVVQWTGEVYELRCMGAPHDSEWADGHRVRVNRLPLSWRLEDNLEDYDWREVA